MNRRLIRSRPHLSTCGLLQPRSASPYSDTAVTQLMQQHCNNLAAARMMGHRWCKRFSAPGGTAAFRALPKGLAAGAAAPCGFSVPVCGCADSKTDSQGNSQTCAYQNSGRRMRTHLQKSVTNDRNLPKFFKFWQILI